MAIREALPKAMCNNGDMACTALACKEEEWLVCRQAWVACKVDACLACMDACMKACMEACMEACMTCKEACMTCKEEANACLACIACIACMEEGRA